MAGITILGLGPGDPTLLTRQVWKELESTSEIYLRTGRHAAITNFPEGILVNTFDHLCQNGLSSAEIINQIMTQVINLGRRVKGVIYAVPGHPFVADATVDLILKQAHIENIPIKVLEGLSPLDSVLTAVGWSYSPQVVIVDALEFSGKHHPLFSPNSPVIVAYNQSLYMASEVKRVLLNVYPALHPVYRVYLNGKEKMNPPGNYQVEKTELDALDQNLPQESLTNFFIPPLGESQSFEGFQEIVSSLRAPDGCPWDREQTHKSLRSHLLSETYEVLAALDVDDTIMLREELGDLLLQIVLHAQIAHEASEFNMEDILNGIYTKIVRRHPHVFGDLELKDAQGVLMNWEKLKAAERAENNIHHKGFLDRVPLSLPALVQAQEYQERANRVGLFPWPNIQAIFTQINTTLETLQETELPEVRIQELGDLLFSITMLAIQCKIDVESALREANARFRERFV